MKWLFILLLLSNVIYLGWEMDRDAQLSRSSIAAAVKIPVGTSRLSLLAELDELPEQRVIIKLDEDISGQTFISEPILPIAQNPNTQNIKEALLTEPLATALDEVTSSLPDEMNQNTQQNRVDERVCYTYGPIPDENESRLFSNWLDERAIQHKQRQTNEQGKQLFWVYLAPQDSRAQAVAALNDLKNKGVRDIRLISGGDLLNAISLGVFSSQAAVNRRLNELQTKGYTAVAVPYSGAKNLYWFDVAVVQNSDYVYELFTGLPARFKARPVNCNEIAMQ